MKHSVRAYLERIPADKLISFLEAALLENANGTNNVIWQDILDALISRNTTEDGRWLSYIRKIQEKQNRTMH